MSRETWRDVVGYEGVYQVSDHGRVKRIAGGPGAKPGRILKLCADPLGYLYVNLYRSGKVRRQAVHRLVAEAFFGPPPEDQEVNHKNGNPSDNRIKNLEWVTHSENLHHAYDVLGHDPSPVLGEANGMSKLTRHDVKRIRELYATGKYTYQALGDRFGVTLQNIRQVVRRDTWKHVL